MVKNWFPLVLIFVIVSFYLPLVTAQEGEQDGNIVIVDSAFVRSGPGDDYTPVGALYAGDRVFPLNRSADSQWVLIPYSSGYGWIRRDLVRWEDESQIDRLVPFPADFTPTPLQPSRRTTPSFPTATPEGDYINPQGSRSVYVRAGPGRGYLRLGQLLAGDPVEAVARNVDGSWIMIRFSNSPAVDGFGWIGRALAYWEDESALDDLPIISSDNLTPTLTFTPSNTPIPTSSAGLASNNAATPTPRTTSIASATSQPIVLPTATDTAVPTATATAMPTSTDLPTATITPTATVTDVPTATNTDTPTSTSTATNTATATATDTNVPTATNTTTATDVPTATATDVPTATNTDTPTSTATTTNTVTATNTNVPTATETLTETPVLTDIFAVQATSVAAEATGIIATDQAGSPINPQATQLPPVAGTTPGGPRLPLEAIGEGILLIAIAIYVWFYLQGLGTAGRYSTGFVITECPVCERGSVHIDERKTRILGIPRVRRTVRCDECRSVLRETGTRRWRYAVDRIENPVMYDRFNGQELSDDDLERLAKQPPKGLSMRTHPQFLDEGQDDD